VFPDENLSLIVKFSEVGLLHQNIPDLLNFSFIQHFFLTEVELSARVLSCLLVAGHGKVEPLTNQISLSRSMRSDQRVKVLAPLVQEPLQVIETQVSANQTNNNSTRLFRNFKPRDP